MQQSAPEVSKRKQKYKQNRNRHLNICKSLIIYNNQSLHLQNTIINSITIEKLTLLFLLMLNLLCHTKSRSAMVRTILSLLFFNIRTNGVSIILINLKQ